MIFVAKILIGLIALQHFYILYFEMFAWETIGKRTFKGAMHEDLFKPTKGLAANQGLYNGFLAVGLIWSLLICDQQWSKNIAFYFLACVCAAGIYGGYRSSKKIFYVQGIPALLATFCLLMA